jgi:hypothetical protein
MTSRPDLQLQSNSLKFYINSKSYVRLTTLINTTQSLSQTKKKYNSTTTNTRNEQDAGSNIRLLFFPKVHLKTTNFGRLRGKWKIGREYKGLFRKKHAPPPLRAQGRSDLSISRTGPKPMAEPKLGSSFFVWFSLFWIKTTILQIYRELPDNFNKDATSHSLGHRLKRKKW